MNKCDREDRLRGSELYSVRIQRNKNLLEFETTKREKINNKKQRTELAVFEREYTGRFKVHLSSAYFHRIYIFIIHTENISIASFLVQF